MIESIEVHMTVSGKPEQTLKITQTLNGEPNAYVAVFIPPGRKAVRVMMSEETDWPVRPQYGCEVLS